MRFSRLQKATRMSIFLLAMVSFNSSCTRIDSDSLFAFVDHRAKTKLLVSLHLLLLKISLEGVS